VLWTANDRSVLIQARRGEQPFEELVS
jgi:hypothetical protein